MVKKLDELAGGIGDSHLVSTVLDSATQIWLAGLGAFAKAQEEGGKIFETLVKEGEAVQDSARKAAGTKMDEMTAKASGAWDKLEHIFEGRVARALHNLSVPSKKDIDTLSKRVAELTDVVEKLSANMAKPAKTGTKAAAEEVH